MNISTPKLLVLMLICGLGYTTYAWAMVDYPVHAKQWSKKYDRHFKKYSKRYFGPLFDWHWFKAQAIAESGLDENAKSKAGARGVMQIMPSTFTEISEKIPHYMALDEPHWNIAAGIYYDRTLYRKLHKVAEEERMYMAFASYNAGYGRVLKAMKRSDDRKDWEQVKAHLPGQTRAYVYRIRKLMGEH